MEEGPLPAEGTGIRHLGPGIEYSLLSAIFDNFRDGLAFMDPQLVIRAANRTFAQQMGRRLEEVVNRPAEDAIPGWTAQMEAINRQARESGRPQRGDEHPFQFADQPERGVTYWEYSVSPVFEPDREFGGYLLAHREVTGRVRGG